MARIAFFGLGEMGYAMAGHLAQAGHAVQVHDLDSERRNKWIAQYGSAAEGAVDVVITSVSDAYALETLARGSALAAHLGAGVMWVDHTTTHPAQARACARFAESRGAIFVDAPMSGGKAGAQAGELTLFVGTDKSHLPTLREVCQAYATHIAHMGAVGAGQATKLAHQLAISGTILGLAAALEYGTPQGLKPTQILAALEHGTAHSIQLTQHAEKMGAADFDFPSSFAWLTKDLGALPEDTSGLPATLFAMLSLAGKEGATGAQ